jgi:uncharacterized membrane protein
MNPSGQSAADERVEATLGNLLRVGVLLAAVVVAAGGVVFLARHGRERADETHDIFHHVFTGEPTELKSPAGVVELAWQGRGRGIIQLGLLLLLATPVARVLFSAVAFARQRDYLYVGLTLLVLALLLFSLFQGFFET